MFLLLQKMCLTVALVSTKAGASTLKCMHCTKNPIYVFRETASSYIHVSVSNFYIPRIGLPIWLQQNRQTKTDSVSIYCKSRTDRVSSKQT
jgi:hypothetical protein